MVPYRFAASLFNRNNDPLHLPVTVRGRRRRGNHTLLRAGAVGCDRIRQGYRATIGRDDLDHAHASEVVADGQRLRARRVERDLLEPGVDGDIGLGFEIVLRKRRFQKSGLG